MPKVKTNRAAAKRFKKTKNGKVKRGHAFNRHLATSKSAKRKRKLRKGTMMDEKAMKAIKELLPYW